MELTVAEMCTLPNVTLNHLYHHAQLAFVATVINRDFVGARELLSFVLNARVIVMSRHGFDDGGHIYFYNEIVNEFNNITHYLNNPNRTRYTFVSGRLVASAQSAGIYIHPTFLPPLAPPRTYVR